MIGDEANAARLQICGKWTNGKVVQQMLKTALKRFLNARSMLQLSRPISNGVVKDWNEMEAFEQQFFLFLPFSCLAKHPCDFEAVWDYTFKKLGVSNPAEHKALQHQQNVSPAAAWVEASKAVCLSGGADRSCLESST